MNTSSHTQSFQSNWLLFSSIGRISLRRKGSPWTLNYWFLKSWWGETSQWAGSLASSPCLEEDRTISPLVGIPFQQIIVFISLGMYLHQLSFGLARNKHLGTRAYFKISSWASVEVEQTHEIMRKEHERRLGPSAQTSTFHGEGNSGSYSYPRPNP